MLFVNVNKFTIVNLFTLNNSYICIIITTKTRHKMKNENKNPLQEKLNVEAFEEGRVWITDSTGPVIKIVPSDKPEKELILAEKIVKSYNMHDDLLFELDVYCKEVESKKIKGEKDYYNRFKALLQKSKQS